MSSTDIELSINGRRHAGNVEARVSLADFLRRLCWLHGRASRLRAWRLRRLHGDCRRRALRSCLMLAVQAQGTEVKTVEGLAAPEGALHPVQQVMLDEHACSVGSALQAW